MKLTWGDIGGAAPAAVTAPRAPALAEVVEDSPVNMVDKADTWINQALDMIRKVDEMVGLFMQLSGKGGVIDQAPQAPAGGQAPAPAAAPPDQILALLDKILQGEGDIPLQKFVEGIRNQEPWLLKYATGGTDETRP